ncbi:MAG: PAS domain S-box protein [Anaerolineaceae bacterium]|nr:PAS domain S-box protein [Anaerolineaceae bacterium]
MEASVKILHLEDDPIDAEMVRLTLEKANLQFDLVWVSDRIQFETAIENNSFDLILADFKLPAYHGMAALQFVRQTLPDIPFIFVSGTIGEDAAIDALTQGATDYVMKSKMARLIPATKRALEELKNIRERKLTEAILKDRSEQFRAIADSAVAGIIFSDLSGKIVYCNPAITDIFGFSYDELVGQNVKMIMPEKVRAQYDSKVAPKTKSEAKIHLGKTVETIGMKKNGEIIPVEVSLSSWQTIEGMFFSAFILDISGRKKSEENLLLLDAAAAAAGNAIVITDKAGNITWANPAFTELTGYQIPDVLGKNPRLLKSGEQEPGFYDNLWATISSGKRWHEELINRRADGTKYYEEMTISPVFDSKGKIIHYIAVKQNIDARKQQEYEREIILATTTVLRSASTRSESIGLFLHQIEKVFHAEGVLFVSFDSALNETWIEQGCGPIGEKVTGMQIPINQGISNMVLKECKAYISNDVSHDPNFLRADTLGDATCAACLPLQAQDQVIGAIWVKRKQAITPEDLELLTSLCTLAANSIQQVTLFEKTERQYKQMISIHQVGQAISSILNLKIILDILLRNAVSQLGVDAASILLYEPISGTLSYSAGTGFMTNEIAKTRLNLGEGRAGQAAEERRVISAPDLTHSKDKFSRVILFQQEELCSHHVVPLIDKGEVLGVLEVFSKKKLVPSNEWLELFGILATQAAIAIDNLSLYDELQKRNNELSFAYDATIKGWSIAMDMRDHYSEDHTQRVVDTSIRLAQTLGLSGMDLVNIRRGALLHDIGKFSVPDSILQKTEKLSPVERKTLEKHPLVAYEMLRPISYLKNAIDIPYCHHEKWDGSGYPRGLKGEGIPLAARIFSVVDTWDALTHDRPYRKALSAAEAINEMKSQSGKSFDPVILDTFLSNKLYEQED